MCTVGLIQKPCQLCVWCVLWVRRETSCLGDVYSWSDTEAVSALCLVCLVSQRKDVVSRWCLQLVWYRSRVSSVFGVSCESGERVVVSRWCFRLPLQSCGWEYRLGGLLKILQAVSVLCYCKWVLSHRVLWVGAWIRWNQPHVFSQSVICLVDGCSENCLDSSWTSAMCCRRNVKEICIQQKQKKKHKKKKTSPK